jgi:hypothetical protein
MDGGCTMQISRDEMMDPTEQKYYVCWKNFATDPTFLKYV